MSLNKYEITCNQTNHKSWYKTIELFSGLSEFCNLGIVIGAIGLFYAPITLVAFGAFAFLEHYMDAFIYVFKALVRATKVLGRLLFGIEFEEDVQEHHKLQTTLDLMALALFIATIVLLTAITSVYAITAAWVASFIGLMLVCYSDYYLTKLASEQALKNNIIQAIEMIQSKENYQELINTFEELKEMYFQHQVKNKSFKLYNMLLIGVGVLLICGSATAFSSGLAFLILSIIAKIASVYLAGIGIMRFYHYLNSKCEKQNSLDLPTLKEFMAEEPQKDSSAQNILLNYGRLFQMELDSYIPDHQEPNRISVLGK